MPLQMLSLPCIYGPHSLPAANRRLSPRYTLSCNILRIYVPQILGRRVASEGASHYCRRALIKITA